MGHLLYWDALGVELRPGFPRIGRVRPGRQGGRAAGRQGVTAAAESRQNVVERRVNSKRGVRGKCVSGLVFLISFSYYLTKMSPFAWTCLFVPSWKPQVFPGYRPAKEFRDQA